MDINRQFEEFMMSKNYCKSTMQSYTSYLRIFVERYGLRLNRVSEKEITSYLSTLTPSVVKQNVGMLKILYCDVLGQKKKSIKFIYPKREKKLPQPIDKSFLLMKINKIPNLKHKAIISLGFSVGMRVSEVINLKISDIDSKRMLIKVNQGKGKKDRYLPLTENVLSLLREYFQKYRPKEFLFNGQNSIKYSPTSCNQIVKKYIGNTYHFHQLRHSCFTSLHESGVSLRNIQVLAGHSSSKTTEVYTKVSKMSLANLPLPI